MKKKDLMKKFQELLNDKKMSGIEGINWNSKKSQIQEAIDCLELTDAELDEYMTVFKLKYQNTYNAIINNGDWKRHQYNRFYVYRTVKMILAK